MVLQVNDKSISELQKNFNALFPYLRIEFSTNALSNSNATLYKFSSNNNNNTIRELIFSHEGSEFEIEEDMSVTELKKMFKSEFGLTIKVYRKSDNFWLETNLTDSLTLAQQNQHGKDLS